MIDLHWVDGILLAVLSAIVPAVLAWGLAALKAHLKIASGSVLSTDMDNLVTGAARIALDELSSVAAHNVTLDVKNAAVAKAISAVTTRIQAVAVALGYTPATVAQMVAGEVAKLLPPVAPAAVAIAPLAAAPASAT